MERIQSLITQLYQQNLQGASSAQLLVTVQLLELELLKSQERSRPAIPSKVAVTLPSNWKGIETSHAPYIPPPQPAEVEPVTESFHLEASKVVQQVESDLHEQLFEKNPLESDYREPETAYQPKKQFQTHLPTAPEVFHAEPDAPTLLQHHQTVEVNELAAQKKESLNDRLKQNRDEIANVLKEVPIKDLRKGIGINDRFRFLNELFRNDEVMYERSIKTINSFNVYSEAEYWINRELKFKLGWDDNKETVEHFYHLVRRRFS